MPVPQYLAVALVQILPPPGPRFFITDYRVGNFLVLMIIEFSWESLFVEWDGC